MKKGMGVRSPAPTSQAAFMAPPERPPLERTDRPKQRSEGHDVLWGCKLEQTGRGARIITEAARTLAVTAGVAASAIRRMSPFWFFLELWDLVRIGTGSGPGGGGQTSLKLMDGRSLVPLDQACTHVTFGSTLAPSWRTGLGPISGPFWRRFWDSFWSSFGAPKLSRRGTRRHTEA